MTHRPPHTFNEVYQLFVAVTATERVWCIFRFFELFSGVHFVKCLISLAYLIGNSTLNLIFIVQVQQTIKCPLLIQRKKSIQNRFMALRANGRTSILLSTTNDWIFTISPYSLRHCRHKCHNAPIQMKRFPFFSIHIYYSQVIIHFPYWYNSILKLSSAISISIFSRLPWTTCLCSFHTNEV